VPLLVLVSRPAQPVVIVRSGMMALVRNGTDHTFGKAVVFAIPVMVLSLMLLSALHYSDAVRTWLLLAPATRKYEANLAVIPSPLQHGFHYQSSSFDLPYSRILVDALSPPTFD